MNFIFVISLNQLEIPEDYIKGDYFSLLHVSIHEYPQVSDQHLSKELLQSERLDGVSIDIDQNISGVLSRATVISNVRVQVERVQIVGSFFISNLLTQVNYLTMSVNLQNCSTGQFALVPLLSVLCQITNFSFSGALYSVKTSVIAINSVNGSLKLLNANITPKIVNSNETGLLMCDIQTSKIHIANLNLIVNQTHGANISTLVFQAALSEIAINDSIFELVLRTYYAQVSGLLHVSLNSSLNISGSRFKFSIHSHSYSAALVGKAHFSSVSCSGAIFSELSVQLSGSYGGLFSSVVGSNVTFLGSSFEKVNISVDKFGGLVPYVHQSAVIISDSKLISAYVNGTANVGGVCGWSTASNLSLFNSAFSAVFVVGQDTGAYSGGLCGYASINSFLSLLQTLIYKQVTRTNDSKSFSGGICAFLYSESVLSVDYLKINGSVIKSIHTGAFICGSVVVSSVLKVNGVNISSCKVNVEYQAFAGVITAVLESSTIQISSLSVRDVQVNSKVDSYSAVICAHAKLHSTINLTNATINGVQLTAESHVGFVAAYLLFNCSLELSFLILSNSTLFGEWSSGVVGFLDNSGFKLNSAQLLELQTVSRQAASIIIGNVENGSVLIQNAEIQNSLVRAVNLASIVISIIYNGSDVTIQLNVNQTEVLTSKNFAGGVVGQVENSILKINNTLLNKCKVSGENYVGGISAKLINSHLITNNLEMKEMTIKGKTNVEISGNAVNSNTQTEKSIFNGQIADETKTREGTCTLVNGTC
ncbi:Hypothetical_protein [Hexamita inflata]|uniref:Hypothetical_protein n=1 Tax=Hexamita inflata TaxID=28002 RepID=A0AA86NFK2_9EUKA|nr:Hypothetical protein HINF_LOCUS5884 [Hexamita inflata]